jgi:hypothetical protein
MSSSARDAMLTIFADSINVRVPAGEQLLLKGLADISK